MLTAVKASLVTTSVMINRSQVLRKCQVKSDVLFLLTKLMLKNNKCKRETYDVGFFVHLSKFPT